MSEAATTISTMDVKVGDRIGRAGAEKGAFDDVIWLTVTDVTETSIFCNKWEFDRSSGWEIDHEMGWGPEYNKTGGVIVKVKWT